MNPQLTSVRAAGPESNKLSELQLLLPAASPCDGHRTESIQSCAHPSSNNATSFVESQSSPGESSLLLKASAVAVCLHETESLPD